MSTNALNMTIETANVNGYQTPVWNDESHT